MTAALFAAAFLFGSIPTGLLIARLKGVDLRKVGSGNIGATNVLRAMGKGPALATLAGDMLKGLLPVMAVRFLLTDMGIRFSEQYFSLPFQITNAHVALEGAVGIAAILGHNFSVFLKFKGGKGVATSLGVALALSPHAALMAATIWLFTFRLSGYSSLGGLLAFASFPLCIYIIDYSPDKIGIAVVMAALIFITHRGNIKRLLTGTENRILRKGK
ncbi:MAG TPA: glycerol-3-phosphate 1-O-acyltransferase PlsY [Dissulfurispiraceae bacterium]|nr:glycerol-3-phosphate 1-O-acyltransferase PlsY [Dissulfurispiraceae bacterium]